LDVEGGEGIKASLTLIVQQDLPHFFILDQEKVGVKLNESVIVKGKPMNRNQIFVSG
jgi:hypothetical protein